MDKGALVNQFSPSMSREKERIHVAAAKGRLKTVQLLVEVGSSQVNELNGAGETPIYLAAFHGHIDVVRYLLEQGANLQLQDTLQIGAAKGHLAIVELLVEADKSQVNKLNGEGRAAIHLTAYNGHIDVVRYLLTQGANPRLQDSKGRTALHLAAYKKGRIEVAEMLLEKDPSLLHIPNYKSDLPIHIAVRYNPDTHFIKFLLNQDPNLLYARNKGTNEEDNETLLHMAIANGSEAVIVFCIQKGLAVNSQNARGETPLYYAVSFCSSTTIFNLLVQIGADLNLATQAGDTPLHLAAYKGYFRIVSFLLSRGAHPSPRNRYGEEPFHLAAEKCYTDRHAQHKEERSKKEEKIEELRDYVKTIEELLGRTGAPNIPGKDGMTPLLWACQRGSKAVVKLLLESQADLYVTNDAQLTPLHFAVNQHHFEVVKVLIEHEATLHKKEKGSKRRLCEMTDKNGETVLHYLMQYQDKVASLLSHIAEKNPNDREKTQELSEIVEREREDQAKYLEQYHKNTEIHLEMVTFFLGKGMKVSQKNKDGKTLLHLAVDNFYSVHPAVQAARIKLIKKLIEHNPNLYTPNQDGRYPIHNAVIVGDFETVELLLKKDMNQLHMTDNKTNETLLHLASYNGNIKLIKYLTQLAYEHKIDLDAIDKRGATPLHIAVYNQHLLAAKCLIQAGADLYAQDKAGNSVLHLIACNSDYSENTTLSQYLIDQDARLRREPTQDEYRTQKLLKAYLKVGVQYLRNNKRTGLQEILKSDFSLASVDTLDTECQRLEEMLMEKGMLLKKKPGCSNRALLYHLKNAEGETAAHLAVYNGHLALLQLLNSVSLDLHITNGQQKTLLHVAVYQAHRLPIVEFLVKMAVDLHVCDNKGMTAFHIAIKHQCLKIAEYLFLNGAHVDVTDNHGWTPLHYAVDNQDAKAVQFLLNYCNPKLDIGDIDRKTPFYLAAENGSLEIMRLLVEMEKDLPWSSKGDGFFPHLKPNLETGLTPIHIALQNGHLDVVAYLMNTLSDMAVVDRLNQTLLHYFAKYGTGDPREIEIARRLIDKGLDKDAVDQDKCTPLHAAAYSNNLSFAEFLLDNEVNVYIKNHRGQTPFFVAVLQNHIEFVQLMLKWPSIQTLSLNACDTNGASLLHIAAWKNNATLFELLFAQGLGIHATDKSGETVLHKAVLAKNSEEMIRLLLNRDPSLLYKTNQQGEIALHLAVRWKLPNAVALLLEFDAQQIEIVNSNGVSLLDISITQGSQAITNMLLAKQGVLHPNVEDTPLALNKEITWMNKHYGYHRYGNRHSEALMLVGLSRATSDSGHSGNSDSLAAPSSTEGSVHNGSGNTTFRR